MWLSFIKPLPAYFCNFLSCTKITESKDEDIYSDDLGTVSNWITKLEQPYEALLTYEFFLPERKFDDYKNFLAEAEDEKKAWLIIKHNFIRLYIHKIFGGESRLQNIADTDYLQKFDFQFLDAIRDVERDMFSGRNTLLKEVLQFFMDYDIKKDHNKDDNAKTLELKTEIKRRQEEFSTHADTLLGNLQSRMNEGKEQILIYAKETGASFHKAKPDFEGSLSEVELFSALQLIVKYETGINIQIPVTHNGLGYNNLIYMSLF
jgi:predicted ATP-dependent endonuclease of OLD family